MQAMQKTVMTSKKPWLEEALGRGIRVLVYNGNLDIIVNVAGTNRMINSLRWSGKNEFANSKRQNIWVWNEQTSKGELSGYANDGGGLTYAVIRNAGDSWFFFLNKYGDQWIIWAILKFCSEGS